MSLGILGIVLSAAFLHATWNAIVKSAEDRAMTLGLISVGHVLLGIAIAVQVPFPGPAIWPYVIASTIIHFLYYFLLNHAYRHGDLSLIYPIARGLAPLLVTLGALVFAGEVLTPQAWFGICAVALGAFMLSMNAFASEIPRAVLPIGVATGATIAAYSLVDGLGVRASDEPLGYIAWLFIFELFVPLFVLARRGRLALRLNRRAVGLGILGGALSGIAYGLVIYAKNYAPLGMVSALRETSVMFAAAIGALWLGEGHWRARLPASIAVAIGVALIALA